MQLPSLISFSFKPRTRHLVYWRVCDRQICKRKRELTEIPQHHAALITVSSPLGILWQTQHKIKALGVWRDRQSPNISETLEAGETPPEAAVRGCLEELGLAIAPQRLRYTGQTDEIKPSPTTGAIKHYFFSHYDLELSGEEAERVPLEIDEGDSLLRLEWRPKPGGRPRKWPIGDRTSVDCMPKDRAIVAEVSRLIAWGQIKRAIELLQSELPGAD